MNIIELQTYKQSHKVREREIESKKEKDGDGIRRRKEKVIKFPQFAIQKAELSGSCKHGE